MPTRTVWLEIVLTLAMAFVPGAASSALAQAGGDTDIRVRAELSSPRAYVNDPVELTVTVEGAGAADRPVLRLPKDVQSEFLGGQDNSTRFTSIINGQRTERISQAYVFTYRITAAREGTYTIPAPEVVVAGRLYTGRPVTLLVERPSESSQFTLRLEVDRRELYVGEPARMRLVWGLGASVKNISFASMPGLDAFEIATPRNRVPSGQRGSSDDRVETTIFGRPVVGVWTTEVVGNREVRTLSIDLVIVPKEPGTHTLGPMNINFDAIVGERPRGFFDAPWDDRSVTQRIVVSADPITVDVKPLPDKGRPADFSGLVGAYTLQARAEPASVSVGDPITLKLIADGPDPTDRISPPDLASAPAFRPFKLSTEGWHVDSGDLPGPRAFSTTIRVSDPAVTEIPAIEIPYFDPGDGQYKRARSAPLALTVRPTREVTAADAVGAAPAGPVPVVQGSPLESAAPGPVANAEGAWILADEGGSLAEAVRSPLVLAALAGPPLAFFAITLAQVRRERHGRADAVVARARRDAVAALRTGSTTAPELAASLRRFAGAVLGIAPEAVTPVDCRREGSPELTAVGRVLDACDVDRFGGGGADLASAASHALAVLEKRAPAGAAP